MSRFTNDSSCVGRLFAASVIAALVFALPVSATLAAPPAEALTLVVMDPLAKPLSCPCVQGYAQRDYELLAARLERDLKRPITIVFNESLQAALDGDAKGRADIVVGKHSVVLYDAARAKLARSDYWRRRDKVFGFSAFLDDARPEVDRRAEAILSKAA